MDDLSPVEEGLARDMVTAYSLTTLLLGYLFLWALGAIVMVVIAVSLSESYIGLALIGSGVWAWVLGRMTAAEMGEAVKRGGPVTRAAMEVDREAGFGAAFRFLVGLWAGYLIVFGVVGFTGWYGLCIPGAVLTFVLAIYSYMHEPR